MTDYLSRALEQKEPEREEDEEGVLSLEKGWSIPAERDEQLEKEPEGKGADPAFELEMGLPLSRAQERKQLGTAAVAALAETDSPLEKNRAKRENREQRTGIRGGVEHSTPLSQEPSHKGEKLVPLADVKRSLEHIRFGKALQREEKILAQRRPRDRQWLKSAESGNWMAPLFQLPMGMGRGAVRWLPRQAWGQAVQAESGGRVIDAPAPAEHARPVRRLKWGQGKYPHTEDPHVSYRMTDWNPLDGGARPESGAWTVLQRLGQARRNAEFVRREHRRVKLTLPEPEYALPQLDAETLDRAVERDARRYDCGFPLY